MTDTPPGNPDPGQQPGATPPPPPPQPANPAPPPPPAGQAVPPAGQYGYAAPAKSKMTAGLLGIFLGGFGVHRFYLGYTGIGIAQVVVTLITFGIGALWGFVEGILILTGTIDKDAEGRPLDG